MLDNQLIIKGYQRIARWKRCTESAVCKKGCCVSIPYPNRTLSQNLFIFVHWKLYGLVLLWFYEGIITEEWVAIPFSRGSFAFRNWTCVSCIAGRFFTVWTTKEAQLHSHDWLNLWPLATDTISNLSPLPGIQGNRTESSNPLITPLIPLATISLVVGYLETHQKLPC